MGFEFLQGELFSLLHNLCIPAMGATELPIRWIPAFFPGERGPKRNFHHSLQFNYEV